MSWKMEIVLNIPGVQQIFMSKHSLRLYTCVSMKVIFIKIL
jgi:hypothetical protein